MAEKKKDSVKKEPKKTVIRPKANEKPLAIKGDFLEVFQVVKKDKERRAKEDKKD